MPDLLVDVDVDVGPKDMDGLERRRVGVPSGSLHERRDVKAECFESHDRA